MATATMSTATMSTATTSTATTSTEHTLPTSTSAPPITAAQPSKTWSGAARSLFTRVLKHVPLIGRPINSTSAEPLQTLLTDGERQTNLETELERLDTNQKDLTNQIQALDATIATLTGKISTTNQALITGNKAINSGMETQRQHLEQKLNTQKAKFKTDLATKQQERKALQLQLNGVNEEIAKTNTALKALLSTSTRTNPILTTEVKQEFEAEVNRLLVQITVLETSIQEMESGIQTLETMNQAIVRDPEVDPENPTVGVAAEPQATASLEENRAELKSAKDQLQELKARLNDLDKALFFSKFAKSPNTWAIKYRLNQFSPIFAGAITEAMCIAIGHFFDVISATQKTTYTYAPNASGWPEGTPHTRTEIGIVGKVMMGAIPGPLLTIAGMVATLVAIYDRNNTKWGNLYTQWRDGSVAPTPALELVTMPNSDQQASTSSNP